MNILIGVAAAQRLMESAAPIRVIDCRAVLGDAAAGRRLWSEGHIPGALHADLESDLSMQGPATEGRHPLPDDARLSATFSRWGLTPEHWLVAYDAGDGAYAARAWWLATRAGHARALVVDGGLRAWECAGYPLASGDSTGPIVPVDSTLALDRAALIDADGLNRLLDTHAVILLDARAAERFRGDSEPIDAMAGHVPGAHNRPYADNLENGVFKQPETLREEFELLLKGAASADIVHMCGSGVTACHNLLAMDLAGLHGSRLFAPSWSGWSADPERPIAMGGDSPITPAL
ncbi:MAG: sulfurtransferase [Lysobacterales bacterium]